MSDYSLPGRGPSTPAHPPTPYDAAGLAGPAGIPETAGPEPAAGRGGHALRRYWNSVLRYRWLVLATTVLGAGLGVAGSRFVRPNYEVQATFWMRAPERGESREGPIRASQLLKSSGWVDLLQSYLVLDQVVLDERLYLRPGTRADARPLATFRAGDQVVPGAYRLTVDRDRRSYVLSAARPEGAEVLERGAVGDSIGRSLGFVWSPTEDDLPTGRAVEFVVESPRDASSRVRRQLKTRQDREGNFLRISLVGTNPRRITQLLNQIAERFVSAAEELSRVRNRELRQIVEEQYRAMERRLREAERALETFRVETVTLPADPRSPSGGLERSVVAAVEFFALSQDPVFTNYFDMKIQEDEIRRDRQRLAQILATAPDSGVAVETLEGIRSVAKATELQTVLDELNKKRAELRTLRYRYTDDFPAVKELKQDLDVLERRTLPALIEELDEELSSRQRQLGARIDAVSTELRQIPGRAIEEARLRRQVEAHETIVDMLQQRYEEARLAEASTIPDLRVLDWAVVPNHPTNASRAPFLIAAASLGGLGLGLVGAALLDRRDPRLRYPDEVGNELGLAILGALPHLRRRRKRLDSRATAHALEAFRNVRLAVEHAHGRAGPILFTVSSPGVGDGKSFVCTNLAVSFASRNLRTLLIDGDLRKGNLHSHFQGLLRRPGLTDYLAGEASVDQILQPGSCDSLRFGFIGSGGRFDDAPELLQSEAMSGLLTQLRSSYDVIVIDSPPLAAGVDSFVLGTLTGNLLLVLRTGVTDRELAQMKLAIVDRLPIRILGAVLNDVPASGEYRYYGYLAGYELSGDERAAAAKRPSSRAIPVNTA